MTPITRSGLPRPRRATIIRGRVKYATFMVLSLLAHGALAQAPAAAEPKRDDLDVTMQIIVDPDAKLPDEVVRRIPLPERKSASRSPKPNAESSSRGSRSDRPDKSNKPDRPDNSNAREARELGREVGQSARERAKEAAEQREQARRAAAEERRRRNENRPGHPDHPEHPPHPPEHH